MTRRRALGLMLLCLMVAALLRLPQLSDFPPGPHHDEAAYGIAAGDIGLRGARPIFITSFTGREVLFPYLAGFLARTAGNSLLALRLTAAFIGLLTVAATYWLGYELTQDRRLALLAAALLAVSFWHLLFSRLGFRAISQPLLQALTVAALLRGLRQESRPWLTAAGVGLGLTGYTYLAARLFPIPLALAALPLLLGRDYRRRGPQLALVLAVALTVLSPLLLYFWRHPETFWVRVGQVAPDQALTLLDSYGRSLGIFFLAGDPYWRFNLPGRPLFTAPGALLLLLGGLYCGRQLWRERRDWQRFGYLLLLLLPWFMILPTALAAGEIVPSNLRAIGLLPFLYYLPAFGLGWLLRQRPRLWQPPLFTAVVAFMLLLGGAYSSHLYFQQWATRADLFYDSDADLAAVAHYLNQAELAEKSVYVAALHYRHPTVAFLSHQYDRVKWLPHSQAIALPARGGALYLFPHNSPAPAWSRPLLATAGVTAGPPGPDGAPLFMAYELVAPPPLRPSQPVSVNFGGAISLVGYDVLPTAAGATLPLTLYWRIDGRADGAFTPFVHLEDSWRQRWTQVETFAYPAEQWSAGESVVQRVEIPIPFGAPPGLYRLRVGLFDPASGARLPHLDSHGRYAGDSFMIENSRVTAGAPPAVTPRPPHLLAQEAAPGLQLLGYQRGEATVATGDHYGLALWWWADARLPPLTLRLELIAPDGTARLLSAGQPVYDSYPFADWPAPHFLIDPQRPRIPVDFPPGVYQLQLSLWDSDERPLFTADLGALTVVASERLFSPPPLMFGQTALFGDEIRLLGFDLQPQGDGRFALTLVWQALRPPAADYTVFVQVLDEQGVCCVWQQDVMPRQGSYPTGRWLAGEVVVDSYTIELPPARRPGRYPLQIGLYLAESGQRLRVTQPGLPDSDALRLRFLEE